MSDKSPSIFITGGTRGFGLSLAGRFLAVGARVAVCGRDPDAIAAAMTALPDLVAFRADLTRDEERRMAIETCRARIGGIDILVNNAALCRMHDLAEAPRPGYEDEIATNLTAPIALTQMAIAAGGRAGVKTVVNVSTGGALVPLAALPLYSATKAALHNVTLSMRRQLAPRGIRVVEVFPPTMPTKLIDEVALVGASVASLAAMDAFAERTVHAVLAERGTVVADAGTRAFLALAHVLPRTAASIANRAIGASSAPGH
jgi:uncharacterized oxidoreductase